jgi:hypothetical protein
VPEYLFGSFNIGINWKNRIYKATSRESVQTFKYVANLRLHYALEIRYMCCL